MFTITEYSAFHSTTRRTFDEAVDVATRYASYGNGGLPATITGPVPVCGLCGDDVAFCPAPPAAPVWVVYEGGQVEPRMA